MCSAPGELDDLETTSTITVATGLQRRPPSQRPLPMASLIGKSIFSPPKPGLSLAHAPVRRKSRRLRKRSAAPVLVALPAHPPRAESPQNDLNRRVGGGSTPTLHFSTKHYPALPHSEENAARRAGHTHFPRLPPDHAPGPLPDGASASFSYRGLPQPPFPGAAPPVPPPPGGTPLVLDRERPAPPAPEFKYVGGPSQQAVLANTLSQCINQVDQLRTQLVHAEARIASLSARSNPSAALAQAEARAEAPEARLAAVKDSWRGIEDHLDMLSRPFCVLPPGAVPQPNTKSPLPPTRSPEARLR
ncbi:hypothetical protein FRC09_009428 [Ceratobasidium sp. 395]|nr:hypothetical protein FRC09_009428 [Ceratobasidium sp. 395]